MPRIVSEELARIGHDGAMGVARFLDVYNGLMLQRKNKLIECSGNYLLKLLRSGSIVCIGIAYLEFAIEFINVIADAVVDRGRWNVYARERKKINEHLDTIFKKVADRFTGTHIAATTMSTK